LKKIIRSFGCRIPTTKRPIPIGVNTYKRSEILSVFITVYDLTHWHLDGRFEWLTTPGR
jgi:hypothetical protein